jgi:predicted nuclease of predicted toxin-antitoxin system
MLLAMETSTDEEIWNYAKKNNCTIVTQDTDFHERSIIHGFPPKIIWLRCGNSSTKNLKKLLTENQEAIKNLESDNEAGCLQILD